jgi:hypothetical protein
MLIGRHSLPSAVIPESIAVNDWERPLGFYFSNANLYGIKSLNWVYGMLDFRIRWGRLGLAFRDYGIRDLYSDTKTEISFIRPVWRSLAAGLSLTHDRRAYGDNLFRGANDYFSIRGIYSLSTVNFMAGLVNVPFHRGIKGTAKYPESILAVDWQAEDIISLYGLFYKDDENHTRLDLGQKLLLAKPLVIDVGFLTGPQVYYAGAVITYKRIAFEYIFYDVNELPGCWSLTLSYR